MLVSVIFTSKVELLFTLFIVANDNVVVKSVMSNSSTKTPSLYKLILVGSKSPLTNPFTVMSKLKLVPSSIIVFTCDHVIVALGFT